MQCHILPSENKLSSSVSIHLCFSLTIFVCNWSFMRCGGMKSVLTRNLIINCLINEIDGSSFIIGQFVCHSIRMVSSCLLFPQLVLEHVQLDWFYRHHAVQQVTEFVQVTHILWFSFNILPAIYQRVSHIDTSQPNWLLLSLTNLYHAPLHSTCCFNIISYLY